MTEEEEITKQIDLIYKNLLDKFNPTARQLISAGKAYLKSLHAAMACSKSYLDILSRLARQSQQSAWGGSADVGSCLGQMVDVYKEIQAQQMNILKAFYVDLLVPLENNLDRDAKVLQGDQKKFLATHKQRFESFTKASNAVKKHKKKGKSSKQSMDKEIKHFQTLDEEKAKLDNFLTLSMQDASKEERRRYGFILERQSSLAKHYLAYHTKGASLMQHHLHTWTCVAKTREDITNQGSFSKDQENEGLYNSPIKSDSNDSNHQRPYRRTRSVEGSCNDLTASDPPEMHALTRTRSEFHLNQSHHSSLEQLNHHASPNMMNRRSIALPEDVGRRHLARALYPYSPSADNQLGFLESDVIAMIGDKNKGWQYGENMRTQRLGWYPVAYTEPLHDEDDSALGCSNTSSRGRSTKPSSSSSNSKYKSSRARSADAVKRSSSSPNKIGATRWSPSTSRTTATTTTSTLQPATSSSSSSPRTNVTPQQHRSSSSPRLHSFSNNCHDPFSSTRSSFTTGDCQCSNITSSSTGSSTITCLNCSFSSHEQIHPRLGGDLSFHSSDDSGYSQDDCLGKDKLDNHYQSFQDLTNSNEEEQKKFINSLWSVAHCTDNKKPKYFSEHEPLQYSSTLPGFAANNTSQFSNLSNDRKAINIDPSNSICKKKGGPISPCAQKIAAQREKNKNKKKGKKSIKRSSSLLCLDISSCRGVPKELLMADYEDVWSGEWEHSSLIDIKIDIPSPPPFEPPQPPTHNNYSTRPPMPLPHELDNSIKEYSHNVHFSSSSGNSTLEGNWSSDDDAYMVVPEDTKQEPVKTVKRIALRKHVARSLTWASPDKKLRKADQLKCGVPRQNSSSSDSKPSFEPPPRPAKPKHGSNENTESPPLPPRKHQPAVRSDSIMNGVNLFNYSDFINRRLRLPEGISRLDQRSCTSGNLCGPWYDLWGDDQMIDIV